MLYILLFFLELIILHFLSKRLSNKLYLVFYRLTKRKTWAFYILAILFLPGTFFHEASHLLAALSLFVPAGKLELMPEIKGDEVKLGSVSLGKTDLVRRFLIGIAPFIFGTLLILATVYFVSMNRFIDTWWKVFLAGYIVFEVGNTMFASKRDLEGSLKLFLILLVVYGAVTLLGVSFPFLRLDPTILTKILAASEAADFYLLVPMGIDLVAIFLLNFLKSVFSQE